MKTHTGFTFLALFSFVFPVLLTAQVDSTQDALKVYDFVEVMPEYPGGSENLYAFLAHNIVYPRLARDNGIEGVVYAQFVVLADGRVSGIEIRRGIGGGCDEEVLRVLNLMPYWIPGKQGGVPVNVKYTLPVSFKLSGNKERDGDKNKKKDKD